MAQRQIAAVLRTFFSIFHKSGLAHAVRGKRAVDTVPAVGNTAAEFDAFIKAEQARWKPAIARAQIKPAGACGRSAPKWRLHAYRIYNACMRTLQIRELPQALYDLLSFKAQQHHRSLTQQTIAELEQALQPNGQDQRTRRLQTLHKLRSQAPVQRLQLGDQLERWQREDRER